MLQPPLGTPTGVQGPPADPSPSPGHGQGAGGPRAPLLRWSSLGVGQILRGAVF